MLYIELYLLRISLQVGQGFPIQYLVAALILCALALIAIRYATHRARVIRKSQIPSTRLNGTPIPTFRSSSEHISREFARMRRYDRPLAVVVIRLREAMNHHDQKSQGNGSNNSNGTTGSPDQLRFLFACSLLFDALRESDIATYDPGNNQFILLLPESNKSQAMMAVKRLQGMFLRRATADLESGIAEFPNDGLIADDLVSRANEECKALETINVSNAGSVEEIGTTGKSIE